MLPVVLLWLAHETVHEYYEVCMLNRRAHTCFVGCTLSVHNYHMRLVTLLMASAGIFSPLLRALLYLEADWSKKGALD